MSYFDKVILQKFTEVKTETKSKALTVDELIDQSFVDQIKISNGETVKSTNGKPKQSWLSDKGEVTCKVGVLPLFTDQSGKSRKFNCDKGSWNTFINTMYEAYKNGELSDDISGLKSRKAASDKKNKESREQRKIELERDKMKAAMGE